MVSVVSNFIKSAAVDLPSDEFPHGRIRLYAFYTQTAKAFRDEIRQECPDVEMGVSLPNRQKGIPLVIKPASYEQLSQVLNRVAELKPELARTIDASGITDRICEVLSALDNVA